MDLNLPADSDLDRLLARPPRVVRTAAGPIEVAEAGEGPPLLSVHGSGGGWGYALGMAAVFALNGFRVIAPSRPGYHGTPLTTGRTYEQQADTLASLLDSLGVDRAATLALSGGGPPSYLLATRHPERVAALVEVDALSTTFGMSTNPAMLKLLFSRVGMGLVGAVLRATASLSPELSARLLMSGETTQTRSEVAALARRVMADPYRSAFVRRVWLASTHSAGSWLSGQRNDNDLMTTLTPLSLSGIRCPTLIVHGTADPLGAHSTYAATQIPGAEVRSIAGVGHRSLWINDDAADQQAFVVSWLREHV